MYEFAVTPAVNQIRRRGVTITDVTAGSIGAELELEPGDRIMRVNGRFVRDYLDDLCGPEGLPVRSPIFRVAQIDVPVLLIHGDKDENVPYQQTVAMAESLKNHGKDVETFIVPDASHYFSEQQNAEARRRLFEFLRRHLNRS